MNKAALNSKTPIELVNELEAKLISLGITDFRKTHSKTSFGESAYLQSFKCKVRASDHSTGVIRTSEEIPLFCVDATARLIEQMYYPERFETTVKYVFGRTHEERMDFVEEKRKNGFEVEVINPELRRTKKGKVIALIRIKNVPHKTTRRVVNN